MQPRCKPGDLAIIIEAFKAGNIGTIVHVIGLYSGKIGICAPEGDVIWLARASQPMTYAEPSRLKRRRLGPVPDSQLRPIRGLPRAEVVKQPIDLITE
jgi:hypothetical protein